MEVSDEYLAGIFDGEGAVTMTLHKRGYMSLSVIVCMCSPAPVLALYARFGGKVRNNQKTKEGSTVYRWEVNGANCVSALEAFSDLCLVKGKAAQIALPIAISMMENSSKQPLSREEKMSRISAAEQLASVNKKMPLRNVFKKEYVDNYLNRSRASQGAVS